MPPRSRLRWLFALALAACSSLPAADATYVQFLPCDVADGIATRPNATNGTSGAGGLLTSVQTLDARVLPAPNDTSSAAARGARLKLTLEFDFPSSGPPCADLMRRDWNISVVVDALGLIQPPNTRPTLLLDTHEDLGTLGVLPTFALRVSVQAAQAAPGSPPLCIYAEITPKLSDSVSLAARIVPVCIFVLVVISGLLTTIYKQPILVDTAHNRWAGQVAPQENTPPPPARAILPGVGDCLLYLQFMFLMGALTVRYPGFYQPVISKTNWAVLFSPSGPIAATSTFDGVADGIFETNGTLTGTDGITIMSQVSGTPMTKNVFWNMLLLAGIVSVIVTLVLKLSPMVPSIRAKFSASADAEARPHQTATRTTWNVLRVVFSYFLQPLVAILVYQLANKFMQVWQLVLVVALFVLVVCAIAWMTGTGPSNQLGGLLFSGPKKRYRSLGQRAGNDEGEREHGGRHRFDNRAIFTIVFFIVAFVRGAMIGGVQFNPISQLTVLALLEIVLLISTVVLRPFPSFALMFTCSCLARLAVVVLTIIFLPDLRADIGTRMAIGYSIMAIHAAVLIFACAVPAVLRLARMLFSKTAVFDEPEIYGVSQLTRRRTNRSNGLRSPEPQHRMPNNGPRAAATPLLSPHSPHNSADAGISVSVRTVPPNHAFRAPRTRPSLASLSSYNGGLTPLDRTSSNTNSNYPRSPFTPTSNDPLAHLLSSQQRNTDDSRPGRPLSSFSALSDGTLVSAAEAPVPLQKAHAPLAPRWKDYSFREADLYYGTPPPDDDEGGEKEVRPAGQSSSLSSRLKKPTVWVQMTTRRAASAGDSSGSGDGGIKKGFEVRRPPRPPGMEPFPISPAQSSAPASSSTTP